MKKTGQCQKVSNNKYLNCPAKMDDGRQFTDYRPSCFLNNLLRMKYNTPDSYSYRQFLIHNANQVRQEMNSYFDEMMDCTECHAKSVPFHTKCVVHSNFSKCTLQDPNGIGVEYQAANMDSY